MAARQVMGPAKHMLYLYTFTSLVTLFALITYLSGHSLVIILRNPRTISLFILFTIITTAAATNIPKVSTILEGTENYKKWSVQIKAALILMGIWTVFEQARPTLTSTGQGANVKSNQDAIDEWNTKNQKAIAFIQMHIKDTLLSMVDDSNKDLTAAAIWEAFKLAFAKQSAMLAFIALQGLYSVKYDISSPLSPQMDTLTRKRQELAASDISITDAQFALILLLALPDSWEHMVGAFLASREISTLKPSDSRARILDEEKRRANSSLSALSVSASNGPRRNRPFCNHCKRPGHVQDTCWKLHGKPDDWEERRKGKDRDKEPGDGKTDMSHTLNVMYNSENVQSIPTYFYVGREHCWMLDSGATDHITPFKDDLSVVTRSTTHISLGDDSTITSPARGTVHVTSNVQAKRLPIQLTNVLFTPKAKNRFLSLSRLTQKGFHVVFIGENCTISKNNITYATGQLRASTFWVTFEHVPQLNNSSVSFDLWHHRFGHASPDTLRHACADNLKGFQFSGPSAIAASPCEGCALGKSARAPFRPSDKRAPHPFHTVHSDLIGPMRTKSIEGSLYVATFLDDYSGSGAVYFLKAKNEFSAALKTYLHWGENQLERRLKVLHSDRGGEYIGRDVTDILRSNDIEHRFTAPYSPQQNGRAERWNRVLL